MKTTFMACQSCFTNTNKLSLRFVSCDLVNLKQKNKNKLGNRVHDCIYRCTADFKQNPVIDPILNTITYRVRV